MAIDAAIAAANDALTRIGQGDETDVAAERRREGRSDAYREGRRDGRRAEQSPRPAQRRLSRRSPRRTASGKAVRIGAIIIATASATIVVRFAAAHRSDPITATRSAIAGATIGTATDRRRGHGYFCSFHNIFHYHSGYDPLGWLFVSFGYDLYRSSYIGDCEVVSQTFYRRGRTYEEVALLCYDAYGYGYIKRGSRRVYRVY